VTTLAMAIDATHEGATGSITLGPGDRAAVSRKRRISTLRFTRGKNTTALKSTTAILVIIAKRFALVCICIQDLTGRRVASLHALLLVLAKVLARITLKRARAPVMNMRFAALSGVTASVVWSASLAWTTNAFTTRCIRIQDFALVWVAPSRNALVQFFAKLKVRRTVGRRRDH
jgi:hypothetical protein